MVNVGPLAAEINQVVWGTPSNFNGFYNNNNPICKAPECQKTSVAALLHGTPVVGVSQTLRR